MPHAKPPHPRSTNSARNLVVVREELGQHVREVSQCTRCTTMVGPSVAPPPIVSRVYLVGQAPGTHEAALGRPFAWTAGKTLFRWFERIGLTEGEFRARVYMAAVCRCFPGKNRAGGDRVPSRAEVASCARFMERELALLRPALVIAVGRLAIEQLLGDRRPLTEVIGTARAVRLFGHACDVIALPHPSGVSAWFKTEPGKTLLDQALAEIARHPAWAELLSDAAPLPGSR